MRIAYVSYGVLTARRAHNLQIVNTIDALSRRGHRMTFINPRLPAAAPDAAPRLNLPGCETVILPAGRLFGWHRRRTPKGRFWSLFLDRSMFAARALRHLRRAKPDAVVTRDLVACLWLLALRRVVRAPVIYELHTLEQVMFDAEDARPVGGDAELSARVRAVTQGDFAGHQDDSSWPGRLYKRFLRHVESWVLRRAASVLVLTAATGRRLRDDFGVGDIRLVPSGHGFAQAPAAAKREQRSRLGLPQDRRIAIYAGLSTNGKGIDRLFATARELPDDCMILFLGEEPAVCAQLTALAQEFGISRLMFRPLVPHEQVAAYLQAADLGLLLYPPGRYLGEFSSPMKLVEYLACGLPVVATSLPALAEIVQDGVNGRLIAPDDPRTMAEQIVAVIRDRALLDRLAGGARASSVRYGYAERARRIEDAVSDCVEKPKRAGDGPCFST